MNTVVGREERMMIAKVAAGRDDEYSMGTFLDDLWALILGVCKGDRV
jgi:hypothetical protein